VRSLLVVALAADCGASHPAASAICPGGGGTIDSFGKAVP
jgi:hypothetical protein